MYSHFACCWFSCVQWFFLMALSELDTAFDSVASSISTAPNNLDVFFNCAGWQTHGAQIEPGSSCAPDVCALVYSPGTKGLQVRLQLSWLLSGCCTSEPVLQNSLCCHSSPPTCPHRLPSRKCWKSHWRRTLYGHVLTFDENVLSPWNPWCIFHQHLDLKCYEEAPLNHIKVIPVIILIDDVLSFCAELFKHGIQNLRHLFLRGQEARLIYILRLSANVQNDYVFYFSFKQITVQLFFCIILSSDHLFCNLTNSLVQKNECTHLIQVLEQKNVPACFL